VNATQLARLETVVDTAEVCEQIEARLPTGARRRQLSVRTLLVAMLLAASEHRPAHLRRVHQALLALPETDQRRLGVLADWNGGRHRLTYRQLEYTFALIVKALAKAEPDGAPSELLSDILDRLLEASIQVCSPPVSSALAVDWTDLETWARPARKHDRCADREAAWGHRTTNHPAQTNTFFGYYLQALTTTRDEHGPQVPELVRRIHLASCRHDPPAQIVPVIARIHEAGIPIDDLLADSGYSYRQPETFALPIRTLAIQLVIDLHPNDRGPKGTYQVAADV
jgi:hypothetical protein